MKTQLEMSESDIVRSIREKKYSPIARLASRHFKEDIKNIEITNDSIILWNDSINDYHCYRYCVEDINKIIPFIDEWADYIDGHLEEFVLDPISFCIQESK